MLSKIHNCYNSLTETEKRIADRVLSAPQEVVNMSAKELAAHASTVPSAVIRFCKSVGAAGYSDFKLALCAQLGREAAESSLPVSGEESTEQIVGKVFASGIRTLKDTLKMLDYRHIEAVVQAIQQAERVVFFGVGTSSVLATDAQYRFAQLGIATAACTDILFMNVTAANLKENVVAVGISHSGNTKATVNALRRAKKAGAVTVGITSFAQSYLARESDYRLIAFSDDQNYPVEAVSARIAHMCILDALMMALAGRNHAQLSSRIRERNEVLQEIRYKQEKERK